MPPSTYLPFSCPKLCNCFLRNEPCGVGSVALGGKRGKKTSLMWAIPGQPWHRRETHQSGARGCKFDEAKVRVCTEKVRTW